MTLSLSSSDGIGRSGALTAFLCIHSQLERFKTEGEVDIFKYLKTARTRRIGLLSELVSSFSLKAFSLILSFLCRINTCSVMKFCLLL